MSWVAEILRKRHRTCSRCRLSPTHIYDPKPDRPLVETQAGEDQEGAESGTPLCNGCLAAQLARDFSSFKERAILFEPALGPEALVFQPFDGERARRWPAQHISAARAMLDGSLRKICDACGRAGRFLWVPVESDANLWADDWLACLVDGTLAAGDTYCGACAAARLMRSIEERGLCFEAVVPPRVGDGILIGAEV